MTTLRRAIVLCLLSVCTAILAVGIIALATGLEALSQW